MTEELGGAIFFIGSFFFAFGVDGVGTVLCLVGLLIATIGFLSNM